MEGGNKTPIDLEAGLDIHSSDMLVPLAQPTFQHNWQKFQGRYLPNSLRFEKNGWAAGWNVYDFEYTGLRIEQDGLWFGATQVNNNPTYSLNVYPSETSANLLASFNFIPYSSITAVSGCTAELDGNRITGEVHGINFIIDWDPVTETATIDNPNIQLKQVRNTDLSWTITVVDASAGIEVNNNIYAPSSLYGKGMSQAIDYDKYEDGVHYWGQFKFDGTTVTAPYAEGTVDYTIAVNEIKFSYDAKPSEQIKLTFSYDDFYVAFNSCKVIPATGEQRIIASDASTLLNFDYYTGTVTPDSLRAKDADGIRIDMKVPVWLSIAFRPTINHSKGAKKPDNVKYANVRMRTTARFNTYKATSIFDNTTVINVDDDPANSYLNLELNYRFNKIETLNTIEPASGFNMQRYKVRTGQTWAFTSRQFANMSGNRAFIAKTLGNIYTMKACTYKATDYFAQNNWVDWTTKTNGVYTVADLETLMSIRLKTEADGERIGSDEIYLPWNYFDSDTLCTDYVCELTVTPTEYTGSEAALTPDEAFNPSGKYIGGTYERVAKSLTYDADFFPFEWVPKFNLKITTDTGTETYNGVYFYDGSNMITDLEDFKTFLMGTYDPSIEAQNDTIIENISYNPLRVVKNYKDVFDFDYSSIHANSDSEQDWKTRWEKWYPSTPNPADWEQESSTDTKYFDYTNIELRVDQVPTMSRTNPGVVVQDTGTYDLAVDACNSQGVVIWEDSSTSATVHVYQNHLDVTSLYSGAISITSGRIAIDDSFEMDLPSYFDADKSGAYCSYADDSLNRTAGVVTRSGSIAYHANATSDKCWASQLAVSYEKGNGIPDAYEYEWRGFPYWDWEVVDEWHYTLADGVEAVRNIYLVNNATDGVILAQPLWGNASVILRYTDIGNRSTIASKIDELFVFEKTPDSDIPNDGKIWIDRDIRHSYNWYEMTKSRISPVEEEDSGYALMKIAPVDNAVLYYAKKTVDQSTMKEVTQPYYYPVSAGVNGNMTELTSSVEYKIGWVPDSVSLPLTISADVTKNNSVPHVFYQNGISKIKMMSFDIGDATELDPDTYDLPIRVTIDDNTVVMNYNAHSKEITFPATVMNIEEAEVTIIETIGSGSLFNIPFVALCHFTDITGKFAMSDPDTLVAYSGNKYTCIKDDFEYVYNELSRKIQGSDAVLKITQYSDHQNIQFSDSSKGIISAVLTNLLDNKLTFEYKGQEYSVDVTPFLTAESYAKVLSTDIRKPNKTQVIGSIKSDSEFQFVKQQWNTTVEVDNYWWVDDEHILELNLDSFVLKRKTDELDDWAGDRFEEIYVINKTQKVHSDVETEDIILLDSSILKYEVTNTYATDQRGLLLMYKVKNSTTVEVRVHDPRENLRHIASLYFTIRRHEIVEDGVSDLNDITSSGNTAYFNTYNELNVMQLLNQATWSNTITDGRLIIGCHLSNNFDQWTAVFTINDWICESVIQGYGYVGLHGDLTGGMIPVDYFDVSRGFNDKVYPLSKLIKHAESDSQDADAAYVIYDIAKLNEIDETVVGTTEKQWYVKKELIGIVSHLVYTSNGNFDVKQLPLTNKYDSCYKSASYVGGTIGDLFVSAFAFADMFSLPDAAQAVWSSIMGAAGYPCMYMYIPRKATLAYLQQTVGQYAYVHYNSSESPVEKDPTDTSSANNIAPDGSDVKPGAKSPILSDDMTFGKQIIKQDCAFHRRYGELFEVIFALFAPMLQEMDSKFSINTEVNMSSVKDTGKAYSASVIENLQGLAAEAIMTKSDTSGLNSTVVAIKSLDMFYSTSDRQNIHAGPGFVEHQFVADCIAQSVTDCETEGKAQQITFVIKALTVFQGKLTMMIQLAIADGIDSAAMAVGQQMVCGNSLGGVAAGMRAGATAIRAAQQITKLAYEQLEAILDVVCARGITSENTGSVSRHAMTTEGKHKYGEKNETFMWPCWGIPSAGLDYTDETVNAEIKISHWQLTLCAGQVYWQDFALDMFSMPLANTYHTGLRIPFSSIAELVKNIDNRSSTNPVYNLQGEVPFCQATCSGSSQLKKLPEDMAKIEGVAQFLPKQSFRNENIGVSDPVFTPSMFQDYIIDKNWNLSQCCTYGMRQWVSCKDTKITNCAPSNMRVTGNFCGIATSYSAIEIKRGLSKAYMRPIAITPTVLLMNCSGYNSVLDNKLYHSCDGYSYRLVDWVGAPGLNKNNQTYWYAFQVNDRFKRSNKFPANEVQGNFTSEPTQAIESLDKVYTIINIAAKEKGMEAGTIGEDKDLTRWAIPIFTEPVTTLPAAVKTITAMPLVVVDGITGLVTDLGNNQTAYKAPLSVDFTIGKNVYRQTEEFICSVTTQNGVDVTQDLIPSLGLKYIGSTPTEAFFYSKATRHYYSFSGSSLVKMDMMERFRDIQRGYWDFINQEVIMPCLMTFKRLNAEVEDKDSEADNIIVPVLSRSQVSGELPPPITTIFNDRSWYKAVSLPSGFAYQGPNRAIINRQVFVEYMLDSLKGNLGKWKRLDKEKYVTKREYPEVYKDVVTDVEGIDGWTYNPFMLVTSALGQSEDTDCMFEWIITFCWPIEMDLIYGTDNFAVVNICAETMTPGGKVKGRPTHVQLTKELFTRTGNYGYYSFRFQSKNGAGNRERLHIWSDQYIAISSLECECKVITSRRNEQLTQQLDVQKLKEL